MHTAQALGSGKIKLSRTYLTLTIYLHLVYFIPICLVVIFLKTPFSYMIPGDDRMATADAAW